MFESAPWRLLLAAGAVAALVVGTFLAARGATSPTATESVAAEAARARGHSQPPAQDPTAPKVKPMLVFVSGAVVNPGTYRLARGARVADAIDAAGGLLPEADSARLPNLAGRLSDGRQVKVPRRGSARSASTRVDINSATVEELEAVPGVDPPLAEAIVSQRDGYGPFTTLTELHTLLGLDTATVGALRPYLKVVNP